MTKGTTFKRVLVCRTEADQVLEHGVLVPVPVLQLTEDVPLPGLRRPETVSWSQDLATALRYPA